MSGITSDELREWRELCERATPGPWAFTASAGDVFETLCTEDEDETPVLIGSEIGDGQCWFNWEFIATAREALPRCLAEIERLKAKIATTLHREEIRVLLPESNLGAQLFFKACGFRAVDVLRGHFEGTGEDAYQMRFRAVEEKAAAKMQANRISEY